MNNERRSLAEFIFGISIAVMNRLTYAWKFGLMSVLLMVPIGVLGYLNTRTQTEQVEFNFKEHLGVDYGAPLKDFLGAVQRTRILKVAEAAGDASFRDLELEFRRKADDAAAQVSKLDAAQAPREGVTYGQLLKTTERWSAIRAQWEAAKGQVYRTPAEADAAFEPITAQTVDLMLNYVANFSNLILDPDLDSYWLMDAYVGKLPAIAQAITKGTTLALTPGDESTATARQFDLAGYFKSQVGTVIDLRDVNMATTFKETVNKDNPARGDKLDLQANLQKKVDAAVAGVEQHGETVIRPAFVTGQGQPRTMVRASLAALDELYALYDAVTPELDALIMKRVTERYERPRSLGLIALGTALLLLNFLFAGFFLSVRSSVTAIGQATRRIIAGTEERFAPRSRDELGDVLEQYNNINTAINEARTLRAKVEADNEALQVNILDMLTVVSNASDGDLTVRARVSEGALGNVADAFNQLLESLQRLIGEIDKQQSNTTEVVKSIRQTVQLMADGATKQAKELGAASSLVENMSKEIELVSTNAQGASDAARRTEGSATDGARSVGDVVSGMERLRLNVQSGAKKMKLLGDRSMEITGIVSVINRISEQTNMLALNAAIEAARAGEHGRGFSVVAEEVRKLAERTATATQEIDKLVKTIQVETNDTVAAMDAQTEAVERESTTAAQAGESLARIKEVSTRSAALVQEISNVAAEQVSNTHSVVTRMGQISTIAQQTEVGAQRASAAMVALVAASEQLSSSIQRFKLS